MSPHERLKKKKKTTPTQPVKAAVGRPGISVFVTEPRGNRREAFVPALVAAGQTGLPATQEAVFGALLLAAGGSLDWR